MTEAVQTIRDEALRLPEEDRRWLAEELLGSFVSDRETEAAWDSEIQKRIAEVESGEAKLVDWKEVKASASGLLRKD